MQFKHKQTTTNNNNSCIPAKATYFIGDHLITQKTVSNDLGIIIDEDLTFKQHYNAIISKAYKTLHCILKCFDFFSLSVKLMLCKTFVRPHLEYCSIVWAAI